MLLTLPGNQKRTRENYINWSALLPKDKQTICSLATCRTLSLSLSLSLLLPGSNMFFGFDFGVKIACDPHKLCNYFAYARLSKLYKYKLTGFHLQLVA